MAMAMQQSSDARLQSELNFLNSYVPLAFPLRKLPPTNTTQLLAALLRPASKDL